MRGLELLLQTPLTQLAMLKATQPTALAVLGPLEETLVLAEEQVAAAVDFDDDEQEAELHA
jgi:hypothetical protein